MREKLNCSPDAYTSVLWAGIFLYFGSHHDLGKTVIQEVLQASVDPSLNMREGYDQVEFAYSDFLVNEYKQSSATIDMLSPEKITDRQYKLFSIFKELRKTEPCMVEGMPEGNVHVQTEMQVQTESQAQKNNNTCVCDS